MLPGMWHKDCTEIQEGFVRWINCDVFLKGLLYPKGTKTPTLQALLEKQTVDLEAASLIKSKIL